VADGDVRVVRVHDGLLGVALEEILLMLPEVLVNGRVVGDEEDEASSAPRPARPACCHALAMVPG